MTTASLDLLLTPVALELEEVVPPWGFTAGRGPVVAGGLGVGLGMVGVARATSRATRMGFVHRDAFPRK